MKKTIIILFELLICYFLCEIASFYFEFHRFYQHHNRGGSVIPHIIRFSNLYTQYFRENKKFLNFDKHYNDLKFRPISGTKYNNKKSIILFGCSFTHGSSLRDNQTFSHKLSEFTKRKVYNRAYHGWGIQNMLYQLRRQDFYSVIKESPEYIIYTYWNHRDRLYKETGIWNYQVFYKLTKDNQLKESYFMQGKFPLYGYFAREIRQFIANEKMKDTETSYNFMLKHFEESRKEINKHWPNAKFVIFLFGTSPDEKNFFKQMQKEKGYNVIFLEELSNIDFNSLEYQISEADSHPNEKALDIIVPLLAKKLGIK